MGWFSRDTDDDGNGPAYCEHDTSTCADLHRPWLRSGETRSEDDGAEEMTFVDADSRVPWWRR